MLQGSLENFALDEVLGLLSSTSKTGQLDIKGDRGNGALVFRDGRLVDGNASFTANGNAIEDVMFELLRYSEGNFTFNARDVEPSDYDENVVTVLGSAENRLMDWRSIEMVVPSLNHMVTPAADLPAEEISISRGEWSALTTIGAGCPASTVCERLQLGEVEGSRQIKNLAERQLVVISEPGGYRGRHAATPPPALAGTPAPVEESRPPMPPTPSVDDLAPPSPSEISDFGDGLSDASELLDASQDGGLLMQYIKGDE